MGCISSSQNSNNQSQNEQSEQSQATNHIQTNKEVATIDNTPNVKSKPKDKPIENKTETVILKQLEALTEDSNFWRIVTIRKVTNLSSNQCIYFVGIGSSTSSQSQYYHPTLSCDNPITNECYKLKGVDLDNKHLKDGSEIEIRFAPIGTNTISTRSLIDNVSNNNNSNASECVSYTSKKDGKSYLVRLNSQYIQKAEINFDEKEEKLEMEWMNILQVSSSISGNSDSETPNQCEITVDCQDNNKLYLLWSNGNFCVFDVTNLKWNVILKTKLNFPHKLTPIYGNKSMKKTDNNNGEDFKNEPNFEIDEDVNNRLKQTYFYFVSANKNTESVINYGSLKGNGKQNKTKGFDVNMSVLSTKLIHVSSSRRAYLFVGGSNTLKVYYNVVFGGKLDDEWIPVELQGEFEPFESSKNSEWTQMDKQKTWQFIEIEEMLILAINWICGGAIYLIDIRKQFIWTHQKKLILQNVSSICYDKGNEIMHFFVGNEGHKITNLMNLMPVGYYAIDIVTWYIRENRGKKKYESEIISKMIDLIAMYFAGNCK